MILFNFQNGFYRCIKKTEYTIGFILTAIIAHFAGLLTCGLFVRTQTAAKNMVLGEFTVTQEP